MHVYLAQQQTNGYDSALISILQMQRYVFIS